MNQWPRSRLSQNKQWPADAFRTNRQPLSAFSIHRPISAIQLSRIHLQPKPLRPPTHSASLL